MTHPILEAIDTALEDTLPKAITAMAEGHILSEVQEELDMSGSRITLYRGVNITRSLVQLDDGWLVRTRSANLGK